jgi:hypothetical protein
MVEYKLHLSSRCAPVLPKMSGTGQVLCETSNLIVPLAGTRSRSLSASVVSLEALSDGETIY